MRSFVRTTGPFTQSRRNWKAGEQGVLSTPPPRILVDMVTLLESGGIDLGVAQNYLYWHHGSLNFSKKIGFFPFNWVPENPTRGPRVIDLKWENTKSIIMITNIICLLLIVVVVNSQGLITPP